ncbi:MAG TPA: HAD family hydrolase [Candidatus Krumholzibacteria bacterium]|nr:HAD family hydrolase [Candidatus Krumholzibacteria bacterium]
MTRTRVEAVVFDLDGTLVDSGTAVIGAVATGIREVAERHGHGRIDVDPSVLRAALGRPAREYFRTVLPRKLVDLADEVKEVATRHEVDALREGHGRTFDAVLPTLDALRSSGRRLACVSNAQAPYFRAALDHLGLGSRFAFTECQEELPAGADPPFKVAMLRRALAALDVAPARAVMVGDREEDLVSGRTVGCRTIGAVYGFGEPDEFVDADATVERFAALVDVIDAFE